MKKIVNINKQWKFTKEECSVADAFVKAEEVLNLPHTWNADDGVSGGNDYHRGVCTYTKNVEIEKHDGRVYLDFEGVNSISNVYLNGVLLGEHRGGYSGFRYDITDIAKEGENEVVVKVDNTHNEDVYPLYADFTFYGGIYRNVNLIYSNNVSFKKSNLASSGIFISQNNVTDEVAEVGIKVQFDNFKDTVNGELAVSWTDAFGNEVKRDRKEVEITSTTECNFDVKVENPILWDGVNNPHLYNVTFQLLVDGEVKDEEVVRTGLRYFEFDVDKGFILNGKPMRLNGVSRHQDRALVGNALTKAHHEEDIQIIKEVGANSIRLAHYQHDQYFYDLCDEYGMVVWAEIPYISRVSKTDLTAENAISQMRELIRQSYNHASIMMWGVQNEIGLAGQKDKPLVQVAQELHDVVKEEDLTRPTTQAQVMMIEVDDPANLATDIVAYNKYYGWYVGEVEQFDEFLDEYREEHPNRGLCISEYGAEGILKWHSDTPRVKDYTEEYHALYHEKAIEIFNKRDWIWGTYVWNFFDFGSDIRDEGGIKGMNNKGLVTFDRKTRKDAFYMYQSKWSDVPMLHIASKRFVNRHLDEIEVVVYSNTGSVDLVVDGNLVETKTQDDSVFRFKVKLAEGENTVKAISGNLEDSTVFNKVAEADESYILPGGEKQSTLNLNPDENVRNWFDAPIAEGEKLEVIEGYFSIKDSIFELYNHEVGRELFDKLFAGLIDNPMWDMIKEMSIKTILEFETKTFPKNVRLQINKELLKIKK